MKNMSKVKSSELVAQMRSIMEELASRYSDESLQQDEDAFDEFEELLESIKEFDEERF